MGCSPNFGYTIERPNGYGYVRNDGGVTDDYLRDGRYELVVATERQPCRLKLLSIPRGQDKGLGSRAITTAVGK
jgi:hypothetical protein